MLSKDFKKENHFRNCADRCCMNCKHKYTRTNSEFGPEGETQHVRTLCNCDPSNPKVHFIVCNFTVCDNWEKKPFSW